jgi:hypothetical protein
VRGGWVQLAAAGNIAERQQPLVRLIEGFKDGKCARNGIDHREIDLTTPRYSSLINAFNNNEQAAVILAMPANDRPSKPARKQARSTGPPLNQNRTPPSNGAALELRNLGPRWLATAFSRLETRRKRRQQAARSPCLPAARSSRSVDCDNLPNQDALKLP